MSDAHHGHRRHMRTDEGDEIIEPDIYDIGGGQRLRVWISGDELWACSVKDHGPLCRLCQPVDGALNALLVNVIDGRMTCEQDDQGEFRFKLTKAGDDAVRAMIERGDV